MARRDDVVIRISAQNLSKKEFDAARKQLDSLGKKAGFTQGRFRQLGKGVGGAAQNFAAFNPAAARASSLLGGIGLSAGAAVPLIGAAGLAGAVGLAAKNIIDLGVELTTLRDKTGISLQGLQELKFVAEQTNVGFNQVTDSVVRLGRRTAGELPEAIKGIKQLGLSVEDVLKLRPEEQFKLIVAEIAKLPNEAQQSAAAMRIFGDAGLQILPLIRSDVEGLIDNFQDLGGALSGETLQAGRDFSDAMTDLKTAALGFGDALGPLIRGLADLTERFADAVKESREMQRNLEALTPEEFQEFAALAGPGGASARTEALLEKGRERRKDEAAIAAEIARIQAEINSRMEGQVKTAEQLAAEEEKRKKAAEERQKQLEKFAATVLDVDSKFTGILIDFEKGLKDTVPTFGEMSLLSNEAAENFSDLVAVTPQLGGDIDIAEGSTRDLLDAQRDYNEALQAANALAQIIGGNLGQLVGQTLAAASALDNLGKAGGLSGLFSAGRGEATGLLGFLGGVGGLASGLGPLVGLGSSLVGAIGDLFGGPDVKGAMRDIGRDIGAEVSEGLAEQIAESGRSGQFFLPEIFREGGLGIDRLAEEVGDLFSFFQRGEISRSELIAQLERTLPILIQNFDQLGPAGQAQIDRITNAARQAGIEVGGLSELIQAGFAPDTLEQIANTFDFTNDQVRELADKLGVDVQTNLQRMAATLGVSGQELKALSEALNVPVDKVAALLESMGISAEDAAKAFDIDLGDVEGGAEGIAGKTERAAGAATQYANEVERAMRAIQNISFPSFPGGTDIPMQHGGFGEVSNPTRFVAGEAGREGFAFFPGGLPSSTGDMNITMNVSVTGGDPNEIARQLAPAVEVIFRDQLRSIQDRHLL